MKFIDILTEYGIEYKLAGEDHYARPGWLQLKCPFCGTDSFHLGFNLHYGYTNCYACGRHTAKEVLHEITGLDWKSCARLLEGLEKPISIVPLAKKGKLVMPDGVDKLGRAHIDYLAKRGFDYRYCERIWKLQGIGIHGGNFRWRIFLPVYFRGEVVSWTTRSICDTGLRYISAAPDQEAICHHDLLYGEDYVRHCAIVHEGPFDVMATGPGAVCTFGLGYSHAQVLRLSKFPKRVICFDSDLKAQQRAQKLCKTLSIYPGETYNVILNAKDAGESNEEELQILRRFLE